MVLSAGFAIRTTPYPDQRSNIAQCLIANESRSLSNSTLLRLIDTDPRVATYELFDRYVHITAPRLVVYQCSQDQNPFIEMIVPIAFYSPITMNSLLAVTAAHTGAPESRYLYGNVLSHLRSVLNENCTGTDVLVATMMLLFFETAEGDCKARAFQHLEGLVRVLQLRRQRGIESHHDGLAIEVLLYHAVTSGIHDTLFLGLLPPLRTASSSDLPCTWHNIAGHLTQTHCLSGLSSEILDFIVEISWLFPLGLDTPIPLRTDQIVKGVSLAARIHSWSTPSEDEHPRLPCPISPSQAENLQLTASLWKYAAFLNLLLIMHGTIEPTDPRVAEVVQGFMTILSTLPIHTSVETCLNWPLVMVGSYASSDSHREAIRHRYSSMERLGFKNIKLALSILEETWRYYDKYKTINVKNILQMPLYNIVLS